MRIGKLIEKYFWLVLVAGIIIGLLNPYPVVMGKYLPKILLGLMLFFVFLKIDAIEILENIRNYRLMIYIAFVYMFIIPLLFFLPLNLFDADLATGILLLTAMPAGVSTPALADIVKGNISFSMSLAIVSQLVAPFTVPLLFWMIDVKGLEINKLLVFRDIALLIFLPMIISQFFKRLFPAAVKKIQHFSTSANILLLFTFVYIAISSQRNVILENPSSLIWKIFLLYIVFILLHFIGYVAYFKGTRESRISVAIGAAYMNNGMAIVLAAAYFKPEIVVLMVLSELPWNTLLEPFRRVINYFN
ncbi:MAG TPA: bile acid:sodium symporter [Bacteroidales bacterium]|nr:bile acid:sodium symporter [Bacteroidales bacterium]